MAYSAADNRRLRRKFSKIVKAVEIPNLIEVQKESYDRFLQSDVKPEKRRSIGLQKVFQSVFPIKDYVETASLEFVRYELAEPKYDMEECIERGMTFARPVKVTVRLVVWDSDEQGGTPTVRDVKEQEVYFGEIPMLTDNGTFIVNGTERVIVLWNALAGRSLLASRQWHDRSRRSDGLGRQPGCHGKPTGDYRRRRRRHAWHCWPIARDAAPIFADCQPDPRQGAGHCGPLQQAWINFRVSLQHGACQ